MYKLTRISLINWYLFWAKDIDVKDATAFIGPTGAGKTALQDALQTVTCGGSHRHIHLNASASGKSERKIIEYCLGYLVPKSDGGEPMRPACETILALVFSEERADGSRHDVTVGLAMSARVEETRERPICRFIAPGHRFSVNDYIEHDGDEMLVKRWDDIEVLLTAACTNARLYRQQSAEKFVADMLAEMRHNGRQPDTRHFLHAFSNAVAFKPIFDPTQFVRTYILEPDPLDVDRVRDSIGRWRDLSRAVQMIEDKLRRLSQVRKRYEDWGALVIDRAVNRWALACAQVELARIEFRTRSATLIAAEEHLQLQDKICSSLVKQNEETDQEVRRLEGMMAERGLQGKLQQITTEQENLLLRRRELEGFDSKVRQALRLAANLSEARAFLPNSIAAVIAAAQAALSMLEKPGLDWLHEHAAAVKAHLTRLKDLAGLQDRLQPQLDDRHSQLTELRKQRDLAEQNAQRIAAGSTPLSEHTSAYLKLLKAEGISALVLCDVVEPVDKGWQFAAESLLGAFREAVIVDPIHLEQANDILFANRNRHGLHKVRLVKTNRTSEIDIRLAPDSLANVLSTNNPDARALICSHLGPVKMVPSRAELDRASRAIMKDGRATAGLAFSVNRDLLLILGRQDGSAAVALREQAEELKAQIAQLEREVKLIGQAGQVAENLKDATFDVDGSSFLYEEIRRSVADLDRRKKAVLSEEDAALAQEIDELRAELSARRDEIEEARKDQRKAVESRANALSDAREARKVFRNSVIAKRRSAPLFSEDDLIVSRRWASADVSAGCQGTLNPYLAWRLESKTREAYEERIKEHRANLDKIDDRVSKLAAGARTLFDAYLRDYGIERPMKDEHPYTYDYNSVVHQHNKLQQNELREHKDRAEAAEKEMYFTLKEDLLVNLNGKFQKLDTQLKTLNSQLRRHRFTNQIYKFTKKPDARFDRLRRLAVEVGTNPDEAQNIIEGRGGDLVMVAAMQELNEFLDNTAGEGMEDYRSYFSFNLHMRPLDSEDDEALEIDEEEIKSKGWVSLTGRAAVGSGGEGQAPFYVAIAASMALAYYPGGHPKGEISGMGLVLFDEAFNKLDIVTTQSLIRFYKDLGLQLILAAPEDKRPTFTEVVDCIVSVNKDVLNRAVHVESEYPTPYAQQQMAAINPEHIGIEGYRARLAEAVDA